MRGNYWVNMCRVRGPYSENPFHRYWVVKTGFFTRGRLILPSDWLLVAMELLFIGLTHIFYDKIPFKPPSRIGIASGTLSSVVIPHYLVLRGKEGAGTD